MGSTIYNKAFTVDLSHNFYVYTSPDSPAGNEFKVNPDFEIVPTEACADLMSKGRMRLVRTQTGFSVFYQAYLDENQVQQPLVALTGAQEFIFAVRLVYNSEEFLNVTDLNVGTKKYHAGSEYFLSAKNTDSPDADTKIPFTPSLIDQLRPSIFTYSFRGKEILTPFNDYTLPVNITVKDESGTNVIFTFTNVSSDPATGIYSQPLDFSAQPNGIYQIEAEEAANPGVLVNKATLYIDSSLATESVFGLIRVQYTTAPPLYTGKIFKYAFPVRSVKWRYFVSIKNDPGNFFTTDNRHLQIIDFPSGTIVFTPLDGEGAPHTGFKIGQNFATVIFTSASPIPFSEKAIKTLKLQEADNGGTTGNVHTLMEIVPNATLTKVDTNALDPTDIANSYAEIFLFIESV